MRHSFPSPILLLWGFLPLGVEIESQRSSKKGETIETLDINIWDELGRRSYDGCSSHFSTIVVEK
jgi:hypothetical protein